MGREATGMEKGKIIRIEKKWKGKEWKEMEYGTFKSIGKGREKRGEKEVIERKYKKGKRSEKAQ